MRGIKGTPRRRRESGFRRFSSETTQTYSPIWSILWHFQRKTTSMFFRELRCHSPHVWLKVTPSYFIQSFKRVQCYKLSTYCPITRLAWKIWRETSTAKPSVKIWSHLPSQARNSKQPEASSSERNGDNSDSNVAWPVPISFLSSWVGRPPRLISWTPQGHMRISKWQS